MLERILIVALLAGIAVIAWRIVARRGLRRQARSGAVIDGFLPGRPAVLYFTAPGCTPCETIQKPALDQLRAIYDGALQILEVDASTRPRLADAWGVLAVPTVFLIDASGRPRRVHHGPVRADVLARQLEEIDGLSGRPPHPPPLSPPGRR